RGVLMSPSVIGGVVAVAAVIVVALALRAMGGGEHRDGSVPTMPSPPTDEAHDGVDDRLVVAVTSDGRAFVPDHHVVRIFAPPEEGEEWKVGARLKAALETVAIGAGWSPGDLRGARV